MKFAYADPPYVGCGHRYPEKREVDHAALIDRLYRDYPDGWALSCSSPSLQFLLPLCLPPPRIAAWVKPFAVFKPNVNPAYSWEPVLFYGGRRGDRNRATVRDWHAEPITLKKGIVGAKPPAFCHWVLDLLGVEPGDEVDDLFPGTGNVGYAIKARLGGMHADNRATCAKDPS